jgi:hypothetical protein
MKLEVTNANYAAVVVKVSNLQKLEGLDNLVGFPVFGCMALIPKGTQEGDVGVVFTAETQLSEDFCKNNNLFRHANLNADPSKAGYLDDSGRIRAIRLRKHPSNALFLSLDSLSYLGESAKGLKVGDAFNSIDGVEVCRKYEPKPNPRARKPGERGAKFSVVVDKLFPKHFDTKSYFRFGGEIHKDECPIVTQKLHGTSARFTHQMTIRRLSLLEKIAKFFGAKVQEYEYRHMVGTRNTIREPSVDTFYMHDVWTEHHEKIKHLIPKNWVIYGEIIGYAGEKEIQKHYAYCHKPGASSLYVYRIAVVNPDGVSADLSWGAVKEFCNRTGLKHVPELDYAPIDQIDELMDKNLVKEGWKNCVPLSDSSPCDEGVCIRVERQTPLVLKAKSPVFLEYETKALDTGDVEVEE